MIFLGGEGLIQTEIGIQERKPEWGKGSHCYSWLVGPDQYQFSHLILTEPGSKLAQSCSQAKPIGPTQPPSHVVGPRASLQALILPAVPVCSSCSSLVLTILSLTGWCLGLALASYLLSTGPPQTHTQLRLLEFQPGIWALALHLSKMEYEIANLEMFASQAIRTKVPTQTWCQALSQFLCPFSSVRGSLGCQHGLNTCSLPTLSQKALPALRGTPALVYKADKWEFMLHKTQRDLEREDFK